MGDILEHELVGSVVTVHFGGLAGRSIVPIGGPGLDDLGEQRSKICHRHASEGGLVILDDLAGWLAGARFARSSGQIAVNLLSTVVLVMPGQPEGAKEGVERLASGAGGLVRPVTILEPIYLLAILVNIVPLYVVYFR